MYCPRNPYKLGKYYTYLHMAAIVARLAPLASRASLPAIRNLLVTFLGVEAVESIWESLVSSLTPWIAGDDEAKKGGPRGVALIDLSTGLRLGTTSRRSALAHLAARGCSRRSRPSRHVHHHYGDGKAMHGVC